MPIDKKLALLPVSMMSQVRILISPLKFNGERLDCCPQKKTIETIENVVDVKQYK